MKQKMKNCERKDYDADRLDPSAKANVIAPKLIQAPPDRERAILFFL